jgi:hypothetical protein
VFVSTTAADWLVGILILGVAAAAVGGFIVVLLRWRRGRARLYDESADSLTGPEHDVGRGSERLSAIEFPSRLCDTVGSTLHLVLAEKHRDGGWVKTTFDKGGFWLLAGETPVAYMRYGEHALVEIACREECWRLTKDRPVGWELNLERLEDSEQLGRYRGRSWRKGGRIELGDDGDVLVDKGLGSPWRMRLAGGEPFAEILHSLYRWHRDEPLRVTLRSLPQEPVTLHLAVLSLCGVILIEDQLARASPSGGAG